MQMDVHCVSPDQEWILLVELNVPDGVSVVGASDIAANGVLRWNEQVGPGVTTTWGALTGVDGFISDNSTANATITLSFAPELLGDIVFNWAVYGDNYGGNPHHVEGEITLSGMDPGVTVYTPVDGDVVTLGTPSAVNFAAFNGPELLDIAIQRSVDGPWDTIAEDVPAGSGSWDWTPSGDPGPYAVIKVSDAADTSIFDVSGIFGIGRNLDWLQLETLSGSVIAGESLDLMVTLSAAHLFDGQYDANIVFDSNGGLDIVIPIQLLVTSTSGVADIPDQVALEGNWPNPFNPQTVIRFSLPGVTDVDLSVYSTRGYLVTKLLSGAQQPGHHQVVWDGRDGTGQVAASGVYFYRLKTPGSSLTGKMTLAK